VDLGIAGRVALVTGASRGLGRAAAEALAREGAKVAICARGEAALRDAEAALSAYGEVLALRADVTDPSAPGELVAATAAHFGRLDIVVGNAGGPPPGRALEVEESVLAAALEANLLTSVRLVRQAVPHMRREAWGRICLITSATVKQPLPELAASGMARAGLWAWAKPAAGDLFGGGITLNLACPGSHATERMKEIASPAGGPERPARAGDTGPERPARAGDTGPERPARAGDTGPLGDPAAFGQVVAFLCSEPAGFVTGTAVVVDGGRTLGL
jgi:3-oxoacyl-[acyl-carrier protein] reductase